MALAATYIAWNRKLAKAMILMKHSLTCVYRPLDNLAVFQTAGQSVSSTAPMRYAIRQVLDQEYQKFLLRQRADARQARHQARGGLGSEADLRIEDKGNASAKQDEVRLEHVAVKRDFFGRIVDLALPMAKGHSRPSESDESQNSQSDEKVNVWVSYHEGFSNAVRKPITLDELMRGF